MNEVKNDESARSEAEQLEPVVMRCEHEIPSMFALCRDGKHVFNRCSRKASVTVQAQYKTEYIEGRRCLCDLCASRYMLTTKPLDA